MRSEHACRPPCQAGFSLLEILVAFAILALSLGVLLRIFGGGGQIAAVADEYSRSIVVAESLMNSLGVEIPLEPGEREGDVDEIYHWTLNVHPYPLDAVVTGTAQPPFIPYWVDLSVSWGDADDPRAFDLKTLRLLPTRAGAGTLVR